MIKEKDKQFEKKIICLICQSLPYLKSKTALKTELKYNI